MLKACAYPCHQRYTGICGFGEFCEYVVMTVTVFTVRAYARVVLGVVILSVRLSITRVDCDKSKWCTADILIPHERAITMLL